MVMAGKSSKKKIQPRRWEPPRKTQSGAMSPDRGGTALRE